MQLLCSYTGANPVQLDTHKKMQAYFVVVVIALAELKKYTGKFFEITT